LGLLLFPVFCIGQKQYKLELNASKEIKTFLNVETEATYDSLSLVKLSKSIQGEMWKAGYLKSEGSLFFNGDIAQLNIKEGSKISSQLLSIQSVDSNALSFFDLSRFPTFFNSYEELGQYQQRLLYQMENNGYPFAQVSIVDLQLSDDTLMAKMFVDEGPHITLDSLVIKGYDKFSRHVLRYFLNFKKGMLYREKYIARLPELINQVEYLKFNAPPAIAFSEGGSTLYLYVDEVKRNQVDGIVGLNTTPEGETTLNGDFQLRLLNIFKRGEEIQLRWRRPDESVQSLNANLSFPFILGTPLWFSTGLQIFRQDSSFVNTSADGNLKYYLGDGMLLTGGVGYTASNTLQSQQAGFGRFNTVQYRIGLELLKTNRVLIPTKGYLLRAYGFSANRNASDVITTQYGWSVNSAYYLNIKTRNVLLFELNAESLFGENLFTNELYRIGGLNTLRGFNEQQLFTSSYAISTLEYRYMLGNYDYLSVFGDVAFAENTAQNSYQSNVYTGLGAGFSFQTNAGIFSLFYAVGRDLDNPFDFRVSKVHFGYVSQF
jgi:outer membrane protein assembly factor BamA